MSSTLVWQIKPKSDYKSLKYQLKVVLEKKVNFPCVVCCTDLAYLSGLRDAGIDGAEELMELIEKFDEIELNLEW
jgi:hypothetical protein